MSGLSHQASTALAALLHARVPEPFAWGVRDCACLAFDAKHAVTGIDSFGDLRGTYSNHAEAAAILADLGGLRGLCSQRLGRRVRPDEVIDGDIALLSAKVCDEDAEPATGALGVSFCGAIAVQCAKGLEALPADAALIWWRPA